MGQNIPLYSSTSLGRVVPEPKIFAKGPVAKTASYTITQAEWGTLFTNASAGGAVTFTLPTPKAGGFLMFAKATVAQNLILQAPSGVKINNGTAGQKLQNVTSEMGTCTLVAISATEYAVQSSLGTWAAAA